MHWEAGERRGTSLFASDLAEVTRLLRYEIYPSLQTNILLDVSCIVFKILGQILLK